MLGIEQVILGNLVYYKENDTRNGMGFIALDCDDGFDDKVDLSN